MYICICQEVTDGAIRQAVGQGISCIEDLQCCLGVATCCGKCSQLATEVMQEALLEQGAS